MRIPVSVEFFGGGIRPMMDMSIRCEDPKLFGLIRAVIDTGSPTTILGNADVQKMRISQVQMGKLMGEEKEVNLGGAQIRTRILPNVEISVGGSKVIIPVQIPVKVNKGVPPPTILGIDFLVAGKFEFVFNAYKRESYLEKE